MSTPLGYPRKSVAAPIQAAAYERMSVDEALLTLASGGVYDEVPEIVVYPYVVLGEAIEMPDNSHSNFGAKTDVAFHIWSDYRGYLEANTIAGRLVELFDHVPLTIVGHRVVAVRFKQNTPMRDPNPSLRHVIVRFQVVTEQEES